SSYVATPCVYLFFFHASATNRDLHSFPTRRSSDLAVSLDEPDEESGSTPDVADARPNIEQNMVRGERMATIRSPRTMFCSMLGRDRKSTRLNSSHLVISYAVFCLKKKKKRKQ